MFEVFSFEYKKSCGKVECQKCNFYNVNVDSKYSNGHNFLLECFFGMKTTHLILFFNALSLDINNGHVGSAIGHAILAILAILAMYGLFGYGRWQYQHGHY